MIDGKTAFTGGINFGDEYINKKERFGYWKDTAVMIKGDAAFSLTAMFLGMWRYVTGNNEPLEKFYPSKVNEILPDNMTVIYSRTATIQLIGKRWDRMYTST